ncbi:MAG: radical SAM protein [Oscillospiraceae bacterium]|nr:radical SAM protein [Oscillospiraceae bacterium]
MKTISAKTIITRWKISAEWFGAEYNMNLYRGCNHGCIYCDSRSECYRDSDFETVKVKENALQIVRDELRRKVKTGVIATGSMSDPYNPLEQELKLTRHALELINAYGFGVAIATKSPLVTRDIDILSEIKSHSPVIVKMTVTAGDALQKKIEPTAPGTSARFDALSQLSARGIYCGVLLMPVLPFITDSEANITGILEQASQAGANFVYPAFGMTLRAGNREYYYDALDRDFPGLKEKYIARYGDRYSCASPAAKKLWAVFTQKAEQLGLVYDMKAIISGYKMGYGDRQLTLGI